MADRKLTPQAQGRHETELRACAELERLPGVISAAVWVGDAGHLDDARIHILPGASPSVIAHAAARVLQTLDLSFDAVDLRITPVPLPQVTPVAGDTTTPHASRTLLLHDITLTRTGTHVTCRAQLLRGGSPATGEAADLDTVSGRIRCAALATLRAAEDSTEGLALGLEGATIIHAFGRSYAVVSVEAAIGRRVATLGGMVAVDPSRAHEEAVCLATLRAIDRWIAA